MDWADVLDMVENRLGMWTGLPQYDRAWCFLYGFEAGRGDGVLAEFQTLVSARHRESVRANFAWPSLLLDECLPGHADREWRYPDDDEVAIAHMVAELRSFLLARRGDQGEPPAR